MLSGEIDFLLKCVAPDLTAFQEFIIHELTAAPNVASVKTSLVIRASKQAIQKGLNVSLEQAIAEQRDYPAVKAMAASQDYIEGPKAFAEKRPPKWLGR